MLINNFIYFHIGVCILLILFEIAWWQYMKIHKIKIERVTRKYKKQIQEQIDYIKLTGKIRKKHCKNLRIQLKNVNNLMAFEKAYSEIMEQEDINIYRTKILYTFVKLSIYYNKRKSEMEKAYFAYIIGKYFKNIESEYVLSFFIGILYRFLQCKSIYCKINAMDAIYNIGTTEHIIRAISIINKNEYAFNEVLLANGLKNVEEDKELLAQELFKRFDEYNKHIQIAIIKFLSDYKYINEELILEKLKSNSIATDVRCEIMRYFQKNKNEKAKKYLMERLSREKIIANDLIIKAIGTLGYYEENEVYDLLNKLKESTDYLIKESVHRSLEKRQKLQKQQLLEVI